MVLNEKILKNYLAAPLFNMYNSMKCLLSTQSCRTEDEQWLMENSAFAKTGINYILRCIQI